MQREVVPEKERRTMSVFPPTKLVAPERITDEEVLAEGFHRRFFRETWRDPGGEEKDIFLYGGPPFAGPAWVLGVTDEGLVILVRLFRHALESFAVECPGGVPGLDEPVGTFIRNRLLRETGYRAGRLAQLSESLITNPTIRVGPDGNDGIPFLALGCVKTGEPVASERTEALVCSPAQLLEAIESGEVRDATTISIVMLAFRHLGWLSLSLPK